MLFETSEETVDLYTANLDLIKLINTDLGVLGAKREDVFRRDDAIVVFGLKPTRLDIWLNEVAGDRQYTVRETRSGEVVRISAPVNVIPFVRPSDENGKSVDKQYQKEI